MAQQQAEAAIKLATEQGFPIWQNWGEIVQGWSIGIQGRTQEGIVLLQQGIAIGRAMGMLVSVPYRLSLLAEVYGKAGLAEEGLAVLTEVPAMMDKSGERLYEAELYRLKGELLLAQESREHGLGSEEQNFGGPKPESQILYPHDEAGGVLSQSHYIARQQQAKSWELRASTSLARLWQQQDKREDARQLVAEIYGWFTEGFDTKDVKDAKALLEKLS
jgi:predicted ATPase